MSNLNHAQMLFTYKDLLLRKLSYSVTCSVLSQIVIFQLYIYIVNFNFFNPSEWLWSTLKTWTSFSTIIFLLPFLSLIFAQSIICAKDYVLRTSYSSTRFQKFVNTFSVHNLVLLWLHVIVGAILIWLLLFISGGKYQNLSDTCKGTATCINEGSFFLILSGFWAGFYFFTKVYIAEKTLCFPVIQQRKILQFKSNLGPIMRDSIAQSFWPSLYYIILYSFWGEQVLNSFRSIFQLLPPEEMPSPIIYLNLWFYTALYYFNMNLMRFFFNLFLTESVEFPLLKTTPENLTLQESISNYDWPIVQNLACLDLFRLAQWSPMRRQLFYTLSQPGGHPHTWNLLVENILKLIKDYADLLNKTIDVPQSKTGLIAPVAQHDMGLKSPIMIQSPNRFRNLRNMAYQEPYDDLITITKSQNTEIQVTDTLILKLSQKFNSFLNTVKTILGINFLFGELPQANIKKCLANGHLIIWSTQGIADIVSASIKEDRYGIVQKDLPAIITTLVQLKQSLDKLNKIPALTRKVVGYNDFNYKMKGAVTSAVKRSLFNICKTFGNYLDDIPLNREIVQYLQVHIICKS